ncbi:MAG: ribosome recycling factor [Candidatus Kerfeldbacteria bacterium]|nr:ribosome recycling factor [Candidatus Kerfeldbacteria bacterium]
MISSSARFQPILTHLKKELSGIHTGRATPSLVEHVIVEAYGTKSPLQSLAAIHAPEPQLLVVEPWDSGVTKEIEQALRDTDLGVNPVVDGKVIRLPFPSMSDERRQRMQKIIQERAEGAKVSIRQVREELIKTVRADQKNGTLSEDQMKLELKNIQSVVDDLVKKIEAMVEGKTKEILTV